MNEQLTEKEKIRIANATIDGYFSKSHLNTDEQRNFDLILSLFEDILTERVALAKQEADKVYKGALKNAINDAYGKGFGDAKKQIMDMFPKGKLTPSGGKAE